jgi:hypothetical protein
MGLRTAHTRWMAWLRACRRPIAALALFALLAQVGLSFGHVHWHTIKPGIAVTALAAGGSAPADQRDDDDYCAICAVLTMLNGAQCATAPALATPSARVTPLPPPAPAMLRLIARHDSFRSRAPPLS